MSTLRSPAKDGDDLEPNTRGDDRLSMTAVVVDRYGSPDVLRVETLAPPIVADDTALVQVRAATLCKGDVHLLTGRPHALRLAGYGLRRPAHRVPGQSLAGWVCAVGRNVTGLRVGQEVFGLVHGGAFAEFAVVPADHLVPTPANRRAEQAAALPLSGLTALQALRNAGQLQSGQRALINGASGGVGTLAVQIAKALGAEVTAVCSGRNVATIAALGADRVVDYQQEDVARCGLSHDVILDLVGNRPPSDWLPLMTRDGVFVSGSAGPGGDWVGPLVWMARVAAVGALSRRRMTPFLMRPNRPDLLTLGSLLERGQVLPVIDRRFSLAQTADAYRRLMEGHAQGTTVIAMPSDAA